MGRACSTYGKSRNAYRMLVGRPEGKSPLERPRRRWEDNIKIDLREVGYDGRDWINLAKDRDRCWAYVRAALNLRATPRLGKRGRNLIAELTDLPAAVNSNTSPHCDLTNDRICFTKRHIELGSKNRSSCVLSEVLKADVPIACQEARSGWMHRNKLVKPSA
ncbi:hypothetical protein ANN_08094 [Periplaneta americana]|uniref:Uncharacterized protein n=1 Tax=Periplaneta americana TaxID=6978 RepID=A0ABQ8T0E5_PERAM|nr:hypothetical protein ANN_08094 [Periplaneta americana]